MSLPRSASSHSAGMPPDPAAVDVAIARLRHTFDQAPLFDGPPMRLGLSLGCRRLGFAQLQIEVRGVELRDQLTFSQAVTHRYGHGADAAGQPASLVEFIAVVFKLPDIPLAVDLAKDRQQLLLVEFNISRTTGGGNASDPEIKHLGRKLVTNDITGKLTQTAGG